jgi:hypothetical protein
VDWKRIVDELALEPHPEGGWYREVYRSPTRVETARGPRSALTTIYYLLQAGQLSRWHVIDADEVWHFYGGAPLELLTYAPLESRLQAHRLGPSAAGGEPVCVVPAGVWQAARCHENYSLVGCSVGPGFEYSGFALVASMPELSHHFRETLQTYRDLL